VGLCYVAGAQVTPELACGVAAVQGSWYQQRSTVLSSVMDLQTSRCCLSEIQKFNFKAIVEA